MKQIIYLLLALILCSCARRINGSRNIITKTIDIGNYTEIHARASTNVYLDSTLDGKIRIEAPEELMDHILCEVKDNALTVGFNNSFKWWEMRFGQGINVYVPCRHITRLVKTGSANISGSLETTQLAIETGGSGHVNINVNCQEIRVSKGGSSGVTLKGRCTTLDANLGGSGHLDAGELATDVVNIRTGGSTHATVNCNTTLVASASGSSKINYSGNPSVTKRISGSAKVRKAN
ncbi:MULTISPECIES: head GIN domain-containing protein [unclassified Chitinophaga]|uniref:head GIN domain-containing protein n=1 Tax=unclassified Chitinophaga TaxID=2619133 RepID=UPI0009CD817D|nr:MULTISPECIES: head GIN domain-containing protein [unclassified Chitinophaga]OMP76203.1 hypothetical protein BW716_26355 [[Flexibacter] sp. ATCC 35208]WPV65530.1 head GIN domain-containing protein [Chitinophaga sp. LS1]